MYNHRFIKVSHVIVDPSQRLYFGVLGQTKVRPPDPKYRESGQIGSSAFKRHHLGLHFFPFAYLFICKRPSCSQIMPIIGWWCSVPEQRLGQQYSLSLNVLLPGQVADVFRLPWMLLTAPSPFYSYQYRGMGISTRNSHGVSSDAYG